MKALSARKVPYVDLAAQHAPLREELLEAAGRVISHGQFILGPEVARFEERFAKLCRTRYAVGVANGTDALGLALRALGIGPGDEVITAPNSFVASASAVALVGARPVFSDVGPDYNLDPKAVERAVTSRTKAILPVHLTGRPADMDALMGLAKANGLRVVEDCAQAVLAEYKGRRVGSFGSFGAFSLHPLKTLNACGDGGVLTTNDEGLYRKALALRNIGLETRDRCVAWSGNSRLDTIQAAFLLVKLKHLEKWTEARQKNAAYYQKALDGVEGLIIPTDRPHEKAVFHTFVVMSERRDALKAFLAERGIGTSIHYPVPIHLQPAAAALGYKAGDFPQAERQARRILSLPAHHELSEEDLAAVAAAVREFHR